MRVAPAARFLLFALPAIFVLSLGADLALSSDGRGHARAGSPAASTSGSHGGKSNSASPGSPGQSGGSTAERRLGPSGGLNPTPSRSSTHVVVVNPWWGWGYGWGWGWGWGWPYAGYWGWEPGYPGYGSYGRVGPSSGAVAELHISPRKATVLLDGKEIGQARDYNSHYEPLFIPTGTHSLEFEYPGYQTLTIRVDGVEGQWLNIRFDLDKGEGVDPRSEHVDIPDASSAPGGPGTQAQKPETPEDSPRPAPAPGGSLRTGRLRIHVEPEDAAVYLDGEFLGTAGEINRLHGAFSVPAGEHRIEAVRPGHESRSETLLVREDEPATVRLVLPED